MHCDALCDAVDGGPVTAQHRPAVGLSQTCTTDHCSNSVEVLTFDAVLDVVGCTDQMRPLRRLSARPPLPTSPLLAPIGPSMLPSDTQQHLTGSRRRTDLLASPRTDPGACPTDTPDDQFTDRLVNLAEFFLEFTATDLPQQTVEFPDAFDVQPAFDWHQRPKAARTGDKRSTSVMVTLTWPAITSRCPRSLPR